MKRTVSLLMALALIVTMLFSTAMAETAELTYAEGTVLRMATGYNSTKTGLFFDAEVAGEGVTLADGVTFANQITHIEAYRREKGFDDAEIERGASAAPSRRATSPQRQIAAW